MMDPEDDRIRSCVVCYHGSGSFGYLCPQCHHTVFRGNHSSNTTCLTNDLFKSGEYFCKV